MSRERSGGLAAVSNPARPRRSSRREYLVWLEDRVEEYKEALPRAELLQLAEEVIRELETTRRGQYQLTEVLLCGAIDRRIVRLLKLPNYRKWASARPPASDGVGDRREGEVPRLDRRNHD